MNVFKIESRGNQRKSCQTSFFSPLHYRLFQNHFHRIMPPADVTCDLCGGTDFYYDTGFYYCSECQRQTQDIQEHVFDQAEEFDPQTTRKSRKVVSKKSGEGEDKHTEKLTSWECYNYIIRGLVGELIDLGASENLCSTVEVLWFRYLKCLGVVGCGDEPPKLPAVNSAA